MKRKTNAVSGWVEFPIGNDLWQSSGVGGMVVKLVVVDPADFENQFPVCSGGTVYDILTESLIGDDRRPLPEAKIAANTEECQEQARAHEEWLSYHFPHLQDATAEGHDRYRSGGHLCCLVLGTTGWSGWNRETHRHWACSFEDLTMDGQALYKQIEALYPGCHLHLLTFLDS